MKSYLQENEFNKGEWTYILFKLILLLSTSYVILQTFSPFLVYLFGFFSLLNGFVMCLTQRFNKVKTFWPYYFCSLFNYKKYIFWILCGLVDSFNNSCHNITSGLENTANELMIVIQFQTTLKLIFPNNHSYPGSLGR